MNETEIRDGLRRSIGEARYPSTLQSRVEARLQRPEGGRHPRALALIAAGLAVLIVATLVLVRSHSIGFEPLSPAVQPPPSPNAKPATAAQQVPLADLQSVGLSAAVAVVNTPDLVATDHGRSVRLVGAYADTSMLALIFRTLPEAQPSVQIFDGQGWINAGSGWSSGGLGDSVFVLSQAPHVGPDGISHLKIAITSLEPFPPGFRATPASSVSGNWDFALDLKVQPAVALPVPATVASVGSWKVTLQRFELTPAAIHLKATFAGANPMDIQQSVGMIDDKGIALPASGYSGPTTPGDQSSAKVDFRWPRPSTAAMYTLVIRAAGGEARIPVEIPSPAVATKGVPLAPVDYPAADESLRIAGAWSVSIMGGHPQSCGFGSGGSGAMLYSFATYFQVPTGQPQWYFLALTTDAAAQQYHGPGTYAARAGISPAGSDGPAAPIFAGQAQLTVTSDRGLQSGTVNGALKWVDDPTQSISLSGDWTCRFGPQLGPG